MVDRVTRHQPPFSALRERSGAGLSSISPVDDGRFVQSASFLQQPAEKDSGIATEAMGTTFLMRECQGQHMTECLKATDSAASCAFCGKRLPVVNGELQPWRAPNGQFFCNEFCADDAEEVRFRRHGRAERKAHERDFFF
jgi:hypothetical protein